MDRIDTPGSVDGMFRAGNPFANPPIPSTIVGATWLNGVQEELLAVIEAAGLTPDQTDDSQLLQAITALVASALSSAVSPPTALIDLVPDGGTEIELVFDATTDWYENDSGSVDAKVTPAEGVVTKWNDGGNAIDFSTFTSGGTFTLAAGTYWIRLAFTVTHDAGSGTLRWRGALTDDTDGAGVTVYRLLHGPDLVSPAAGLVINTAATISHEFLVTIGASETFELRLVSDSSVGGHHLLRGSLVLTKVA